MQEGAKGSQKLPECVLEVPSLHEVELSHGKQVLPDFTRPGSAAGEPIMKERALLQVRELHLQTRPPFQRGQVDQWGRDKGYLLCWTLIGGLSPD